MSFSCVTLNVLSIYNKLYLSSTLSALVESLILTLANFINYHIQIDETKMSHMICDFYFESKGNYLTV